MKKKTVIDRMVDRFLGWKLPEDFGPDSYITFDREKAKQNPNFWPVGTNLFTAGQARQMVEHMLADVMPEGYDTEAEGDAYMDGYFDALIQEPPNEPLERGNTRLEPLDTVEPVAWLIDHVPNRSMRQIAFTEQQADELMAITAEANTGFSTKYPYDMCEALLPRSAVESLFSQCRKEALLKAAENIQSRVIDTTSPYDNGLQYSANELRRMAEGEAS